MNRILLLCPQGGLPEAEFAAAIGGALAEAGGAGVRVSVACLRQSDARTVRELAPNVEVLESFEQFQSSLGAQDGADEALRLSKDYPETNWWEVVAAERSFIDSSFLVGGLGERRERRDYVETLVPRFVRYFEKLFAETRYSAVVCEVADSLMIHIFYHCVRKFGAETLALSPNAWIREDGRPGFFIAYDEFMHNRKMESTYAELKRRPLDQGAHDRVQRFRQAVIAFDVKMAFQAVTKRSFVVPAYSPNLTRLWSYLRENAARDKNVEYYKIDILSKARANVLRVWRRWRSRGLLASKDLNIPPRSVFFPMQYQPEQTTLVGGIYYGNQISVIENVAKALPFGCTLVVKEHPRGRGSRPVWQYEHLAHFPNVRFCDADAKEILKRCDALITITSTAGLEAMALDRPVILLGKCYFDFASVLYKPQSWPELASMLRRILIEREYEKSQERNDVIERFFYSYLSARNPVALSKETAGPVAEALLAELAERQAVRQPA